ncbi:MAG: tRNA (adenosine(37)-N6)-threonylcarbamoyltransferase complex dimerization subunit type 1 TsaB [Deltaproteobacteria bacterium]|nr:tRNA (adenosine(37)-N6)-threonylcarbamoyltransferase complex dimerization subunit type 1 TsaB [Deltaproteobacteria bacterium]
MRFAALDTATSTASVAILEGERVLARTARAVQTHAQGLLEQLDEALRSSGLRLADVDAFVCGRGPGSFTGLRIGLATVKGICLATGKPLLCVPTLQAFGGAAGDLLGPEPLVAVILDARRQELYCGLYRGGQPVGPEILSTPRGLSTYLGVGERLVLVGDGALRYRDLLLGSLPRASVGPEALHAIDAAYLARAALSRALAGDFDDLAAAGPLYVRPADARLPSPQ